MSFNVIITPPFKRQAKKLKKKFPSLKTELTVLYNSLEENPKQGKPIGKNCYKIRLAIKSKGKGKSGGTRVITHLQVIDENVYMVAIYDKSDKESLTDKELTQLLKSIHY